MSTVAQDPPSKVITTHRDKPSISLLLQNSFKKKSIDDRLDTTEHLLKKISIDIGKIKNKSKRKSEKKSDKNWSNTKAKYTDKVKNLIQKIIMSRTDMRESKESTSGWESGESNTTFKMTGDSKKTQKKGHKARYDRIDEESSYIGSDNVSSSIEITESVKTTSEEKHYGEHKETHQNINKEILHPPFRKSIDSLQTPPAMVLFYDNFWANSKNLDSRTINSARKPTRELDRNKYPSAYRKSSVAISHWEKNKYYDNSKSLNSISFHDSNNYKDDCNGSMHDSGNKAYKNNLRRKIISNSSMNQQLSHSKISTPIKSLNFESDLLQYRREKPDCLTAHKLASAGVPTRTVALKWNLDGHKFAKVPLTTTGRKNAEQIANALRRLSALE